MHPLIEALLRHYPDLEEAWADYRARGRSDPATFLRELVATDSNATFVGTLAEGASLPALSFESPEAGVPDDVPGRGFTVGELVGRGAMGEVRLAHDRDLNRTVAWKVMSARATSRPDLAAAFWCEAQITSQLDHPHIVPIFGLSRADDGRLAYTMRRVAGDTVEAWLAACDRAVASGVVDDDHGLARRLEVFLKVCDAVHFAHHRGVLHRDLKPSNLMIGAHGEVYVMDWGIAMLYQEGDTTSPRVEGYGTESPTAGSSGARVSVIGTPGYMSPEQAVGDAGQRPASDQYALGLILQEMVTLQQAVRGNNLRQVLARHIRGEVDPMVHRHGVPVSPELVAIVRRATAMAPDDRYPSVAALADDVRRHLRGQAVHALPDNLWRGALRQIRRHASLVAVMGLALLLALATAIVGGQGLVLRDRAAAARHERALSELMASTATQAARIDSRFVRFEGHVASLAAAAGLALQSSPASGAAFYLDDFRDPGTAPPDLAPSRAYGGAPISLAHPVLLRGDPGGPDPAALLLLHPQLLAAVGGTLAQGGAMPPHELRARLEGDGAHAAYATVALDHGAVMSFPGHATFPEGYDPRVRPWYLTGIEAGGVAWGTPYVDAGTGELNLPCSAPVWRDGRRVGVASLKLSLAAVVGNLLDQGVGQRSVIDAEGRVLATHPATAPPPRLDGLQVGSYRIDGTTLRVVQPIESHGWALVVEGDAEALLAGP